MNIQQTIERAHFVATDAQVEQLASARWTLAAQEEGLNGTYLRVLVVGCQSELGTKRRGRPSSTSQLAVVDKIHIRFYAAVLRGITTPDIVADDTQEPAERSRRALERNRRSTFARSAKTTLVNFVRAGGDIRTLDPPTVSKAQLRAAGEPPPLVDRVARQLANAQGAILRAIGRRARGDPSGARDMLEGVLEALQAHLDTMDVAPDVGAQTTTMVSQRAPQDRGHGRTRVAPQLHRGAS